MFQSSHHPIGKTCLAGALATAALAILSVPAMAEDTRITSHDAMFMTDAIRIEVTPENVHDCPGLVVTAFNLPLDDSGFGPLLPGVPAGYGPSCAVLPEAAVNGGLSVKSDSFMTGLATN